MVQSRSGETVAIRGKVLLPAGSPPLAGLLIVAVENVSYADSPSRVVCSHRVRVDEADWADARRQPALSFNFVCTVPDQQTESHVVSARLHRGDENSVSKGDALTVRAYPLAINSDTEVILDLVVI